MPTGKSATYEEVRKHGLWTRGVHVLIYTPDKHVVMQKRSESFDYQPGTIEVSAGGGVDTGETPLEGIRREILEELGIEPPAESFVPLGIKKLQGTYKAGGIFYRKRTFVYSYKVCVDQAVIDSMESRDGEATEIFLLPQKQVLADIRRHWIRGHGRLMTMYAYWYFLVRSID